MKIKRTQSLSSLFYFFFALFALFAAAAFNIITSSQKEKSSYFPSLSSQEELREIIIKSLSSLGIDSSSIQGYRDKKHVLHLKIDLPIEKYLQLEENLGKKFDEPFPSVIKKEERQDKRKNFYLWEIRAKEKNNLMVLFSCNKESQRDRETSYLKTQKNKVAIIIDDMGYSLEALRKIIATGKALTISILPFSTYAKETAQNASENGLEVMLHLPLQSSNNNGENDYEGIILAGMSEEEVKKTLEKNLNQIPYIKGVNNHMGSKITTDKTLMRIILERIKQMDLFFIDSVTTTKSIAFELAQEMGVPSAHRHIFLDSVCDENIIRKKLHQLFRHAQKNGKAVGICHPFDETLQVLTENLHLLKEYNLELVFASKIIQSPSN